MATTDLTYLIPDLRLTIGDTAPATYRYEDEWIKRALLGGVKKLTRWWNYRYLVDTSNLVYRNSVITFMFPEPPVIQIGDERPIVIVAALIMLEGSLENNAWDLASWKDAEISFSNLEVSRTKRNVIEKLQDELLQLIKPPTSKLANALKASLPGYLGNKYEREITDLG